MGGLFGEKPDYPDPEPPAAMPDPDDPMAKRERRKRSGTLASPSSSTTDRLAPVPGTLGREFSRSTLGSS